MNLVNYYKDSTSKEEYFLNMDFIECIHKQGGRYKVWMIGSEDGYEISESAYNTILIYGKAKV